MQIASVFHLIPPIINLFLVGFCVHLAAGADLFCNSSCDFCVFNPLADLFISIEDLSWV